MAAAPVRVLHLVRSLGLGGTEKAMQLLAAGLDRRRFAPTVFSFQDGPRREQLSAAGVEVLAGQDLLGTLQRLRPHIVHLHRAGWPEPRLLRTLRLAGVPAVVETNVFGRHDPSPDARIIDRHLFVSDFCLRRYAHVHGIRAAAPRHSVLHNPADTAALAAHTPQPPYGAPVFGRISRADPGKWSRLSLDILPLLRAALPDFRFRVVGAIPEAERFVADHGLTRHVEWLPPLADDRELAGFYGSLALLAHANDTGESFGMTIAEAMACGLPVVTHPCPWPRDNAQLELVEHGVTGYVAATAPDYAAAVVRLLTHPDEAAAMGRAGRDKARRLYDAQVIVRRLEELYEGLLREKGLTPDTAAHAGPSSQPVARLAC